MPGSWNRGAGQGLREGCNNTIKTRVETGLPPACVCLSEPLLQGTLAGLPGSSKEGLTAGKATSQASPPMRLNDRVHWGGTLGSQMYDGWEKKKSRIDSETKRL